MFFKDIIGQSEIKIRLIQSVIDSRVAHAQLFLGSEGSGNLALAFAFAQYITCENKQADDSCGKCASCVKSQKMIHPDIHYSYPAFKLKPGNDNPALSSDFLKQWREAMIENPYRNVNDWLDFIDAENKQGNISAAECRDVIHRLNMKTFESENKILILWMAEYLSKEGNILLKLLEEPPDNTVIILVAENRDQILNTILSRTQMVSIPRLDDQSLLDALMNRHSLSREDARKIIRQVDGNYNEALHTVQDAVDNNQALFNRWMQLLYSNDSAELVKWVEEMAKIGRENQKNFFRYGLEFVRECMLLQVMGESNSRLHDEEKKLGTWLSKQMDQNDWEQMSELMNKSHYHIERNAHAKILFMNLSLHLQKMVTRKKLSLAAGA